MNRNLKYVIAVHFVLYGAADALEEYLTKQKVREVFTIRLPFHHQSNIVTKTTINGKLSKTSKKKRARKRGVLDFLYDLFEVFNNVNQQKGKYDVFIGVNNLNALAGLLLKKFGKVEKVVFYGIDFVPVRFNNKLLNYVYHKIEEYCVINCDEVWNVSPRMAKGREKFLHIREKDFKQKVVPIGVWPSDISRKKNRFDAKRILFVGHMLEKQGVQEVVRAMPLVRKKVKDARLVVVGGGEYLHDLKREAKEVGGDAIAFKGWVTDKQKLKTIMKQSDVAVACYKPEKERLRNFTYYADPTKIKDYLSAGLPVVLTNVPYNAIDLERARCGIIVEYNKYKVASALTRLLTNKKLLAEYHLNSLKYIQDFTWDRIFSKAFANS